MLFAVPAAVLEPGNLIFPLAGLVLALAKLARTYVNRKNSNRLKINSQVLVGFRFGWSRI